MNDINYQQELSLKDITILPLQEEDQIDKFSFEKTERILKELFINHPPVTSSVEEISKQLNNFQSNESDMMNSLDLGNCSYLAFESNNQANKNPILIPLMTDHSIISEYSDCSLKYNENLEQNTLFLNDHSILVGKYISTLNSASNLTKPFKSQVKKFELWLFIGLFIGLLVFLGTGFSVGRFTSLYFLFVFAFLYFAGGVIALIIIKKVCTKYLLFSHILLALFLRNENISYYVKHKVLIRPGCLSKWIEFVSNGSPASRSKLSQQQEELIR